MSDPWERTCSCGATITSTVYRSENGLSTTSSNEQTTYTLTIRARSNCRCTYTASYSTDAKKSEEYQEKIKKLLRKELIKNMKSTWKEDKKEFKSLPKPRSNIQLRGVSFSGRGWA